MLHIALCEDESVVLEYECSLVKKWADQKKIAVGVDSYVSAEQFLFQSEDKADYDILIFDIQMKNMNGMELAKTLRKRGCNSSLIFVTGVKDYAIEGYEIGAVRYLLKPVKKVTPKVTVNVTVKLTVNQKKILEEIKKNPFSTQEELAEIIGITRKSINENMKKLQSQKIIERIGADKNGHWKISKQ